MPLRPSTRALVALLVVQLFIFVISLPGFGVETRSTSQYSAWAGPVFLGLTLLVFAFGVAGLVMCWRRTRTAAYLATAMGVFAAVTVLFDYSGVGGAKPPTGPFILGIVALIVSALLFISAWRVLRDRSTSPAPTPS